MLIEALAERREGVRPMVESLGSWAVAGEADHKSTHMTVGLARREGRTLILTGGITRAILVEPGDTITAQYQCMGQLSVSFK